jgi:hypothetical protein
VAVPSSPPPQTSSDPYTDLLLLLNPVSKIWAEPLKFSSALYSEEYKTQMFWMNAHHESSQKRIGLASQFVD